MDDVSRLLLRLADPVARDQLLDSDALVQVATACYDFDPAALIGATTAVYDRFDLAVPIVTEAAASARLLRAGDSLPWDVNAVWNLGLPPVAAADAVWSGSLVLRVAGGSGVIEAVEASEPDLDAAFAAALAGLPPTATPEQVRQALRQAAEGSTTPTLSEAELDAWLAAASAGRDDPRLLGRTAGGRTVVGLQLSMSAPGHPAAPSPTALPVLVAFLVAAASTDPRQLLQNSALARRALRAYPVQPSPPAPRRTTDTCVCWVLPQTAFDDDGWPGPTAGTPDALRTARLAAARAWLRDQGIAVVSTPS